MNKSFIVLEDVTNPIEVIREIESIIYPAQLDKSLARYGILSINILDDVAQQIRAIRGVKSVSPMDQKTASA